MVTTFYRASSSPLLKTFIKKLGFFETSTSTERACIVTESTCFIDKTFSSQLKTLTYSCIQYPLFFT